jgi:CRISPR/Cas system CMR-associated protein Cmr3 (group 5 of RAMP superfamily)
MMLCEKVHRDINITSIEIDKHSEFSKDFYYHLNLQIVHLCHIKNLVGIVKIDFVELQILLRYCLGKLSKVCGLIEIVSLLRLVLLEKCLQICG